MGMHIAILPDADRGMPRWGVAPSHGLDGRIGNAGPAAVAQLQERQRPGRPRPRHVGNGGFRVRPPAMCPGHARIGIGPACPALKTGPPRAVGSAIPRSRRSSLRRARSGARL